MGERREALKLVVVAAVWLATSRLLPEILWRGLPRSVLDSLSLPAYGMVCQVGTTLVGLAAARLAFRRPQSALGLEPASWWHVGGAFLLAPLVFVVASFVSLKIAEPYLVAELAREGAGASRRNAGAFGRAVTEAPLAVTLVWGAVLAAISEELMFRGAIFGAVRSSAAALFGRKSESEGENKENWLVGALAVAVAAGAFGAMHADMKGSVGIVRVASTTLLGVVCGTARLVTGAVVVAMVVHFTYNAVSLGVGRGMFRSDSEPLLSVVPNPLLALAVVCALAALVVIVTRRASSARQ